MDAPAMLPTLRLQLLGAPRWTRGDSGGELRARFAPLVACVALLGRQSRDAVALRIWPGDLDKARSNLRTHANRLRQETGQRVFEPGGATLVFAAGVGCDIEQPLSTWSDADLLGCGDLLAGCDDAWLAPQRERWSGQLGAALLARAAAHEQADAPDPRVLLLARRATEVAPWLESAWRALIRCHYLAGDHAAALHAGAQLRERLRTLRGALPGAETLELLHTVEHAAAAPQRPSPRLLPSLLRPPRLVGRDAERAALARAWSAGVPFLLRGDAGSGKSRLLADAARDAGPAVLVGARPGDAHGPYATLATLLRALIARQGLVPAPRLAAALAPLLPELGDGRRRDAEPIDDHTLWSAAEQLLELAADSGVASVAVDDLHQADIASVEALRWLTASAARDVLHFGFATRPVTDAGLRACVDDWLGGSLRPEAVDVGPLLPAQIDELVASLGLPPHLCVSGARLSAHVGGQPYLLLETLKTMLLAGGSDAALPLPTHVLPLLQSRLAAVPQRLRPLLQLAAVLGPDFDLALAGAELGSSDAQADAAALEALGILDRGRIVHDLMREAALSQLTPSARRRCHAQAARLLAAAAAAPARIATHWHAAECPADAAAQYHRAGLDALDAGRVVEASDLLRLAAADHRQAGNVPGAFEALHDAFDDVLTRLSVAAGAAAADELATLATTPRNVARVAVARAEVAVHRFHDPGVLGAAREAAALAAPFPDLLPDTLAVLGLALSQTGAVDDAIAQLHRAEAAARAAGRQRKARRCINDRIYVLYEGSRIDVAIAETRDLIGRYDAVGDRASACQTEANLANLLRLAGDPAAALATALRTHAQLREMRSEAHSALVCSLLVTLCETQSHLGRYADALASAEALRLAIAGGRASTSLRAKTQVTQAGLWLQLGRPDRALAAVDADGDTWPVTLRVQWLRVQAQAAALRGLPQQPWHDRIAAEREAFETLPLSQAPWLDWSLQGDARMVAGCLQQLQERFVAAGMPGTARSAGVRRVQRLLEIDAADAVAMAAAAARALVPELDAGLHPWTHPGGAWHALGSAIERAGDAATAAACRSRRDAWIASALQRLPDDVRETARSAIGCLQMPPPPRPSGA